MANTLNTTSVLPWLAAAVLIAGGFFLFRLTWPLVDSVWHNALARAQGAGKAK